MDEILHIPQQQDQPLTARLRARAEAAAAAVHSGAERFRRMNDGNETVFRYPRDIPGRGRIDGDGRGDAGAP